MSSRVFSCIVYDTLTVYRFSCCTHCNLFQTLRAWLLRLLYLLFDDHARDTILGEILLGILNCQTDESKLMIHSRYTNHKSYTFFIYNQSTFHNQIFSSISLVCSTIFI